MGQNASSYRNAKDWMSRFKTTGYFFMDAEMTAVPFADKDQPLCTPCWSEKAKHSHIMTAINELLPIRNDVELLQGGVLNDSMLHEMLITSKKTLAVHKYSEMATRLTTPSSFPAWLLHNVPIAFAGTCVLEDQQPMTQ